MGTLRKRQSFSGFPRWICIICLANLLLKKHELGFRTGNQSINRKPRSLCYKASNITYSSVTHLFNGCSDIERNGFAYYRHHVYIETTKIDSKAHGAKMGPTWVLSAPDGPHVGPMKLAIRVTAMAPLNAQLRILNRDSSDCSKLTTV